MPHAGPIVPCVGGTKDLRGLDPTRNTSTGLQTLAQELKAFKEYCENEGLNDFEYIPADELKTYAFPLGVGAADGSDVKGAISFQGSLAESRF